MFVARCSWKQANPAVYYAGCWLNHIVFSFADSARCWGGEAAGWPLLDPLVRQLAGLPID